MLMLFASFALSAQEADDMEEVAGAVNTDAEGPKAIPLTKDFAKLDKDVLAIKKRYKSLPFLSKELSALCTTDEEKVRAFFIWISNNIGYDCVGYHSKAGLSASFKYKGQSDLASKIDNFYYEYASKSLSARKAVCEGYSLIFQELCKQAGIPCEIVVGRADQNQEKIKRLRGKMFFSTNHNWNRVQLNGTWYYIDCTWASGYVDKPVKRFYKSFKPYYYLVPLDQLYVTHAVNFRQTEKRNSSIFEE